MRKTSRILLILMFGMNFLFLSPGTLPVAAGQEEERQTILNNATDFFATLGKDKDEAKDIVKERKQDRREVRLREKERSRKRAAKRQIKQQQAEIMKKIEAEDATRYSK
ncbi:MAG: hypothetical protein A2787_00605 [Omnitrophica WOR_2 bacterium RIFCSPHIGHO2_01_FULL_48_9]|nr:MAG: hypothetical protein A3D10_02700 [Omnitrophica WOR_2 bacterium RIFCSPHIGHO2_02_FULL_48_11]OGX33632.1 MAG: hypothetical protein A2787_00605 [Omnitrophica WOR_2 bacterium RIFCSPHIGHO2_01_FULL_48_9]